MAEESAHGRCRGVGREDARPSLWGLPEADDGAGGLGTAAHRGCGARTAELAFRPVDPAGDPGLGGAAIRTAVVRSPRRQVSEALGLHRSAPGQEGDGAAQRSGPGLAARALPGHCRARQGRRRGHLLGRRNGGQGRYELDSRLCAGRPHARARGIGPLGQAVDDLGHCQCRFKTDTLFRQLPI